MAKRVLTAVAMAVAAAAAMAAVTFDPATGQGFVGKGDVQLAFGFNNAAMQAVHTTATFAYSGVETTSAECTWVTDNGKESKEHSTTKTTIRSVNASISSDSRKTGQWTGWILNGFSGSQSVVSYDGYDNPNYPLVEDGPCPGNNGHQGTFGPVTTSAGEGSGLSVTIPNHGTRVLLAE